MEPLREPLSVRSVDLRAALNVAPATMNEIIKKTGIQYLPGEGKSGRGAAKNIASPDVRKLLESRGFEFPKEAQIFSFMMCKGGVGKTTSTYFLAQRLSGYGARVLVIDADSQGNLTSSFCLDDYGMEIDEGTPILVDILTNQVSIDEAIIAVTPTLHLIPSSPLNAILEGKIREFYKNPSLPIKKAIQSLKSRYDYILVDCAPALNLTNTAIICASDTVILPATPDKFSQIGLEQTINEIQQIGLDFNLHIDTKIIFTKFDAREYTSLRYLSEIANQHRDKMFSTMIRTAADLKNAITKKDDLFGYKKSNAKDDYDSFARELMGIDKFFAKKNT